jgi:MFS family permease
VQNYSQLLLARIGVGIGEAGGGPPAHAMTSDYYPPEKRATVLSVYSTGVHIGVLIGFLAGGFISQTLGWRAAFMAVGLPGVIFAMIFFFTVREPERGRWESSAQAQYKPTLVETFRVLALTTPGA